MGLSRFQQAEPWNTSSWAVAVAAAAVMKAVAVAQVVIWLAHPKRLLREHIQSLLVVAAMVAPIPPTLRLPTVAIQ
jgi:histidinol-phosphate/aromatic aminotransferase/cobyric acid decarboxylase-like protein